MKLSKHKTETTAVVSDNMKSIMATEKKIKKELKSQHKPKWSDGVEIEPPRLHRDLRLICDNFRISEQSRYRLREWDAASLEDFCLMTDEDYADFILSSARTTGKPIPPLQQRKLRVLLVWARTLVNVNNLTTKNGGDSEEPTSPNNNNSIEESKLKEQDEDDALKTKYKPSSPRKAPTFVKANWEEQFYMVRYLIDCIFI